ncbi:MAG TPA: methyl-accepting chemotaxis protein [Arenimonas sp.]|nr:methyl-accepting chemotaxis protein [Arenimonas sp.]
MSTNLRTFSDKLSTYSLKFWALLLVVSALVLFANLFAANYYSTQENNARALSSELQVLSQKLAKYSKESASGNAESFVEFKATKDRVAEIVATLKKSHNSLGAKGALAQVDKTWKTISANSDIILNSEDEVVNLANTANQFTARVPQLSARLSEVVSAMSDYSAPAGQINLANRQIVLADRMARRVSEVVSGGEKSVSSADALGRDTAVFSQILGGLKSGNPELNVLPVASPAAMNSVIAAEGLFAESEKEIKTILDAATNLYEVNQAEVAISLDTAIFLEDSENLYSAYNNINLRRVFPNSYITLVASILSVICIFFLLMSTFIAQKGQLSKSNEANKQQQQAIMRLLDEIDPLSNGDLTTKATVTEDFTGAIADAINNTVDEMRLLVGTINDTSVQVSASAQETQATATQLAEAAEHQAQQIRAASQQVTQIAANIDGVSQRSAESADVATRSVQIASKGADVVRQTINGMDNIRSQIQETSKRIKRLGESSQEIGSIVELINDIAEQTNILSLNAAIQAASAGEAGRGFAVVADEVQRLAERSTSATKRIESLVQAIQSDTNEAVNSMEQTTAEVVAGARLAEDAGLALGEIETVSGDLSKLIQGISRSSKEQSDSASNITETMSAIQEITTQTSQGAVHTADSIGNLAKLAADLRRSVANFKLPG